MNESPRALGKTSAMLDCIPKDSKVVFLENQEAIHLWKNYDHEREGVAAVIIGPEYRAGDHAMMRQRLEEKGCSCVVLKGSPDDPQATPKQKAVSMTMLNAIVSKPPQHKHRRNQTEAYHKRVQKKWNKRWFASNPSEPKPASYAYWKAQGSTWEEVARVWMPTSVVENIQAIIARQGPKPITLES